MIDSDTATTSALLLLAGSLAGLAGHRDVDGLVERVLEAVKGGEGLDHRDLAQLHRWVERWSLVHPEVRVFYVRALAAITSAEDSDAVVAGVRALLLGLDATPTTRWRLARLHLDLMAAEPGRDLTRLAL